MYTIQNKKQENKEMLQMKKCFSKQYPTLSFDDLQKQNDTYSTDDGCIHYKHKINNTIYSWNYIENKWKKHNENYQGSLQDLFV